MENFGLGREWSTAPDTATPIATSIARASRNGLIHSKYGATRFRALEIADLSVSRRRATGSAIFPLEESFFLAISTSS
jgi:hypothetical protein